ncbi:hypothetical protein MLD38_020761 [Melastoma candidum]|uniref:Uncharacterized protein n=1 Tax=Melastoma candidum TaxID=119954 RepID=A0ACB9QE28_9MYRT|nr:hypothetical protein MLD38_020761 [Melastoma candidum]
MCFNAHPSEERTDVSLKTSKSQCRKDRGELSDLTIIIIVRVIGPRQPGEPHNLKILDLTKQSTEMSEPLQPVSLPPVLQKPPGYRDPNAPPPVRPKAPKQKPILPSSIYDYDHKKKRRKRGPCCSCCCCLCLSLLIVVIVLAAFLGLFYLWFSPGLPVFHLQSSRVTNLTVTPAQGDGGNHVSSRVTSVIEVKNPNSKLVIYYGSSDVDMTLTDGSEELQFDEKRVEGFRQRKGNVTRLRVDNTVTDATVGGMLVKKLKKKEARVVVTLTTSVGVEFWGLKVGKLGVRVDCGSGRGTALKDVENGGVMPRCSVNTLKWINIH